MNEITHKLETDGYAVIPSLLSPDEIARARGQCLAYLKKKGFYFMRGKTEVHAAAKIPDLSWLFTHAGIVNAVRSAIGADMIAFTGHCDAFVNSDVAGWHKDDGRGGYLYGDYFREKSCKIYKVGVYLQDHATVGGLSVRRGSHTNKTLTEGSECYCSTKPGDIVIFDIRITHRGRFSRGSKGLLYDGLELCLPRKGAQMIIHHGRLTANRLLGKDDRVSLFFSFGARNDFTKYFARKNMERQVEELNGASDVRLPEQLVQDLNRQGVAIYGHDF